MRIRNYILPALGILLAGSASGVDIKPTVTKAEDFAPEGWKLHSITYGDLDQDGEKDAALVIQQTDEQKIIKNDGMGKSELDANPRILLVVFKNGAGYELALKNENILPSQDDAENPCMEDILGISGGIRVTASNTLKISLHFETRCDPRISAAYAYTFRYQNNRFELIGLDNTDFSLSPLATVYTSASYSTGKIRIATETYEGKLTEKWARVKTKPQYDLQTLRYAQLTDINMGVFWDIEQEARRAQ
ncbi:MAG: hypothetical protein LBJ59_01715 [Zoogloeaceae bacterium]|jgi:hypothetical protein|nr:hypothetical protein [Zoogloeaceae bacterium]